MNALCQSKKLWSHLGVAVQSLLKGNWWRSDRSHWESWRIMRTWIVAFFSSKKIQITREDVDCLFGLTWTSSGCNRTGPVPQQNQRCWGAGNILDDFDVMCFWWNTILSHPYRKGLHLVYKWLYLKFGCDQALVAALAAGAAPKLRELKLYRTLWGGEHSWCLWDLKNSETREKSDSVMWMYDTLPTLQTICCVNDCNSFTPFLRSNEFGQLAETMLTQGLPVFRKDLKARAGSN